MCFKIDFQCLLNKSLGEIEIQIDEILNANVII